MPKLRFPIFQDSGEWNQDRLGNCFSERVKKSNHDKQVLAATQDKGVIPYESLERSIIRNTENLDGYKLVLPGDFVISLRSFEGGFEFSSNEGIISPAYTILHSDLDIDSNFFRYYFKRPDFIKQIQRTLNSSLRDGKTISYRQASELRMSLPSKAEQTKIADCLISLDDLIAVHMKKLEVLKAYKKGLMQRIFPAERETMPGLRFPKIGEMQEWHEFSLVQAAKFRRGSFPQPYGLPKWYDETNGMPFIQVFDVNDALCLKPKTKNKISKLAAELSVFIPKDTLIITIQGSIGRVAITQYDAYIDRTLLLFEKYYKPIEKKFFAYLMQNLFELEKEKAPGAIIKTITKEVLSNFKIKLPSLKEQQKIAAFLSSLDDLISAQSAKIDALKVHKKGLMQQLFPSPDEASP